MASPDAASAVAWTACRHAAGTLRQTVLLSVPGPIYRSRLNSQPRQKPANWAASIGALVIILRWDGLDTRQHSTWRRLVTAITSAGLVQNDTLSSRPAVPHTATSAP